MSPSGATGSGESPAVIHRSASGVVYAVLSVSELSVLSGSAIELFALKPNMIVVSAMPISSSVAWRTKVRTELVLMARPAGSVHVQPGVCAFAAGRVQFQAAGKLPDTKRRLLPPKEFRVMLGA